VVNINSFNHKRSQSNTRSNAKETNCSIPFLTAVIVYISLIPFAPTSIQGKRLIKAYNTASRGCDVSNDKFMRYNIFNIKVRQLNEFCT